MMKYKTTFVRCIAISSLIGLSGCQSTTGCFDQDTQCFGSSSSLLNSPNEIPVLNPQFDYIRLNMNGSIAWLAKGAEDQWPIKKTKVFYSADRSVFKWANGRLISVTLPTLDWRERTPFAIDWTSNEPIRFMREIDGIDGSVAEEEIRELVQSTLPKHEDYVGDKNQLVWMHEYTVSKSAPLNDKPSFDSWYAFESPTMTEPVYGQHCISENYCLSWQVWEIQ